MQRQRQRSKRFKNSVVVEDLDHPGYSKKKGLRRFTSASILLRSLVGKPNNSVGKANSDRHSSVSLRAIDEHDMQYACRKLMPRIPYTHSPVLSAPLDCVEKNLLEKNLFFVA